MKRLLILISALITPVAFAQQVSDGEAFQDSSGNTYELTLEECLRFAFGNNNTRQSLLLNEQSLGTEYDQSRNERLPSLSATIGENLNHSKGNEASWDGSYGISTSMTLFQGGTVNNTIEQNRLYLEQSAYRTDQYDNQLTVQILQSFLNVLGSEELLKYQRAVLSASEEQLKQGEALHNAGSIIESDYLLLRAQYVSDRSNIISTEITRDNSLLSLKNLLSMDPLDNLQIVYPDSTLIDELLSVPTETYVLDRAMITMPDLVISDYNVAIAETSVKLAKANLYPTVSLGGNLGTGHTTFNSYGSQINNRRNEQIGVSISIPIYNKGRNRSQITQRKIALRQAELENEQTTLDIRQTVAQEYLNVLAARNNYEASMESQQAYFESFQAYRARFNFGSITTVDLLQQQNNYINALNSYIQNKYQFILLRKVLDVYMGIPVTM